MQTYKLGPVSDDVARAMLGDTKYEAGGGWCTADGVEWYLCHGAHKCGHWGWKIMERR